MNCQHIFFSCCRFYLPSKQFYKNHLLSIPRSYFFPPERINHRQGLEKTLPLDEVWTHSCWEAHSILICQLKVAWGITHCRYLIKSLYLSLPFLWKKEHSSSSTTPHNLNLIILLKYWLYLGSVGESTVTVITTINSTDLQSLTQFH